MQIKGVKVNTKRKQEIATLVQQGTSPQQAYEQTRTKAKTVDVPTTLKYSLLDSAANIAATRLARTRKREWAQAHVKY